MGIFGRGRKRDDVAPPERGSCGCTEHIEDLAGVRIPVNPDLRQEIGVDSQAVADLVETGALDVEACLDPWLRDPATGSDDGPYHWSVWYGDESRLSYDDAAPLQLDDSLRERPGVDRVAWLDREVIQVGSTTLCRDGMLAAAARALADPRVRLPED